MAVVATKMPDPLGRFPFLAGRVGFSPRWALGLMCLLSGVQTLQPWGRPAAATEPYNLGIVTISQQNVPEAFQAMPIPLTGGLAVPAGEGAFPVVVMLHGRHAGCHFAAPWTDSQWPCPIGTESRFDLGFAYLAEALAAEGYIALTIDLNGAYSYTYGATAQNYNALADQRTPQIIDAHLQRLAAANAGQDVGFGVSLANKVDFTRMAGIGHSMGGGAVVLSSLLRQDERSLTQISQGLGPFAGLLLLAPTRSQPIQQRPETYQLPNIPISIVLGGCDRDIFDASSTYFFETASQDRTHTALVGATMVWGANHNFFSQALDNDDYSLRPDNPFLCDPAAQMRLSRSEQEQFLIAYSRAFLAALFGQPGASWAELGLAATEGAPRRLYGAEVATNLGLNSAYQPIFLPQAGSLGQGSSSPISSHNLDLEICPGFSDCAGRPRQPPALPNLLRIRWSAPGAWLVLKVPPAQADMSPFAALQLRLAADPRNFSPTDGSPALALVLRDRSGHGTRVELPASLSALRPPVADLTDANAWVYPTAVRIPLAQLQGVNLQQVAQVELWFDQRPAGTIYLAEMGAIGRAPGKP